MAITAQMVKDLRERTGAGMMDCKKALVEVDGDMEKAIDWLRQKGMAKAAKKSGRATAEGLVRTMVSADGKTVAMASLLCETDFVSRGEQFQGMVDTILKSVIDDNPADMAALEAKVGEDVKQLIATIGENMQLGKFVRHSKAGDNEVVGQYVHANGKIGVLVWLECGKAESANSADVQTLVKDLAMQVAAACPMALDADSLDKDAIAREREVYRQKALAEGKPANIVDKIAEGAVKKYQKEVCLLEQAYIRDDKKSISDLVRDTAKAVNDTLTVKGFERIQLAAEE